MLTDEEIKRRHLSRWSKLVSTYGDRFSVPSDEVMLVSELLRADHVTQLHYTKNSGSPLANTLREYGIHSSVIKELTGEEPEIERRHKRSDKYKTVFDWCAANVGKQTTAQEIASVGGFSLSTASTLIKDRVDYFKRVKRGEYIIRNPAAERAEEK